MDLDKDTIFNLEETAIILNVSKCTLRRWDNSKFFVAGRTKGKHRIYTGEQINKIKNKMFSKRK
jgi:DNA-binding transcriptional MerR regulator